MFVVVSFGVGFVMCLFGGFVIGMYVDCVGCKKVMIFMLLLMVFGIVMIVIVLIFV